MCAPRGELAQSEWEADRHPCFSSILRPPSHPFHRAPFSPPHFTIIVFYSQFPSFSSSFSSFPPTAKPSTCLLFHNMNSLLHHLHTFTQMFYIMYTSGVHTCYILHLTPPHSCFSAFSHRLISFCCCFAQTYNSHFCHNCIHSVFSCNYSLGIHCASVFFFFFLISPTFPPWGNPLCSLLLGERERETERESLQVPD